MLPNKLLPLLFRLLFISLFCLSSTALATGNVPNFQSIKNNTQRREKFFNYLRPIVISQNKQILINRKKLLKLYSQYKKTKRLSPQDRTWLKNLYDQYHPFSIKNKSDWNVLIKRVDIVPVSLVLAQAANETASGTSRFARQGNNYFGQWCSKKGCGIVPKRRNKGAIHEVKKFNSVSDSVRAYLYNLNTHQAYENFRNLRAQLRQLKQPLNGEILAAGLLSYSQRHSQYVQTLQWMIGKYGLAKAKSLRLS